MPVFGVDCSDFDWSRGPMDVASMVRDGIVFLTAKATEGTSIRHAHYGEALNRARAAGMPVMGAYMVPRTPGNNGHGTIEAQVAYFLAYLDQQTPWWRTTAEFFLQVDTEHWGYDDVSPAIGAQACALLRQQTGKWVIHYAPRWAYGDTIPGDDPLWESAYGTNPAVPYRQAYPGDNASDWTPYSRRVPTFLQYGSQLTIGSQPGCDANAYRGTLDELRALITRSGDDVSQQAENILWAVAVGMPNFTGADGKTYPNVLWQWQVDNTKRLDALEAATKTEVSATSAPTQDQVDAAVLKALQDPGVQAGIGAAVASHLKVV